MNPPRCIATIGWTSAVTDDMIAACQSVAHIACRSLLVLLPAASTGTLEGIVQFVQDAKGLHLASGRFEDEGDAVLSLYDEPTGTSVMP